MEDLKHLFKENYLKYASYVILDRAIPDVVDGLKPVQRRILYTLFKIDDGKLHKVANVTGQTMALHPHGDAPIGEALVNLANKGYLIDTQGNFGNPFTGDPPAAARYIEARLSPLAKDVLFNAKLTQFVSSYDGRNQEPVSLPAKIPLCLLQGAEGIAVGMSTKILPHNFCELLEAEISYLQGKPFKLLPDFPSGGRLDPTSYDKGRGSIKMRATLSVRDDKTLVIDEICPGTTTESLIRSIDEAAKKGKIKIDSISDFTAEKVEIEIKLPRGQHASQAIDALYAFTECEVTIHSNIVVIKDKLPWEATVDEILIFHVELLSGYLKRELELEKERLLELIFQKTLEQIFIENRLYKRIENINTYEKIHKEIADSLKPFHQHLMRIPTDEDRERLLQIPIRRISRFDIEKNSAEIKEALKRLEEIEKELTNIKRYTIQYLQNLLKKYGSLFPRRTKLAEIEELDVKKIATRQVKVNYDPETGYIGTKVSGSFSIECTNFDKLLILYENGVYIVMNLPEKQYIHAPHPKVAYIGVADKETILGVLYRNPTTQELFAKRFIVKQFILEKTYRYYEEECTLEFITSEKGASLKIEFKPKEKQKIKSLVFHMDDVAIKGVNAKGIRIASKAIKSINMIT